MCMKPGLFVSLKIVMDHAAQFLLHIKRYQSSIMENTSMLKKHLIVLGFILSSVLLPSLSYAACTLSGVIVRVTAYDDNYSGTGAYVYFRTSSLSPYYYYYTTNDDDMVSNAIAYMDSGRTATIQGNVATCPAVPAAGGAGYLGTLNYIYNP